MMHHVNKFLLFYILICLGHNALGSKIINGQQADEGSMLYMASVQNHAQQHICGGFLVSKEFVVTAAHCDDKNLSSVVLGTHNLEEVHDDTMRYGIKKCKHPSYESVASGYDIMLLKLSRKAKLNKATKTRTIPLPSREKSLKAKTLCSVAGWGFTKTGGRTVNNLQVVNVTVIDLIECKKKWKNVSPTNAMCAGGYNTTKGFCQGDSGGPLVCNGKAVGVVSFNNNNNCDYPELPNIYTDISKYLTWINNNLGKKFCGK